MKKTILIEVTFETNVQGKTNKDVDDFLKKSARTSLQELFEIGIRSMRGALERNIANTIGRFQITVRTKEPNTD